MPPRPPIALGLGRRYRLEFVELRTPHGTHALEEYGLAQPYPLPFFGAAQALRYNSPRYAFRRTGPRSPLERKVPLWKRLKLNIRSPHNHSPPLSVEIDGTTLSERTREKGLRD